VLEDEEELLDEEDSLEEEKSEEVEAKEVNETDDSATEKDEDDKVFCIPHPDKVGPNSNARRSRCFFM